MRGSTRRLRPAVAQCAGARERRSRSGLAYIAIVPAALARGKNSFRQRRARNTATTVFAFLLFLLVVIVNPVRGDRTAVFLGTDTLVSSKRDSFEMAPPSFEQAPAFSLLQQAKKELEHVSISSLVKDQTRNDAFYKETKVDIHLDFTRQRLNMSAFEQLLNLAGQREVSQMIQKMFSGELINTTEQRAAAHVALRVPQGQGEKFTIQGKDVLPEVHEVQDQIRDFTTRVRSGQILGYTGKSLTDVISIGIGGSYLGAEFVHYALAADSVASTKARGRRLHFLANVDPVDVFFAEHGFNPETTLVVIISKTFTTAETILNALTVRQWFSDYYGGNEAAIRAHFCAVSTNLEATEKFGIPRDRVFGFWDWVGGRFSVTSAVGLLPLSLQYGWDIVNEFLRGAHAMDVHFRETKFSENLPVIMGLLSVWNSSFWGYSNVAVLPYAQGLMRFPAHIQQLTMESNGKRVTCEGKAIPFEAGEIYFGEPGTNGQHSFYQLLHQGRVVPCEFIGVMQSQHNLQISGSHITNHDELMSNFFAQPDALAFGKSEGELQGENVPQAFIPHKTFPGNRPSTVLLLPKLTPFYIGQLLALYEHRTAVEGWMWGINSFDQYGVELGKVLAKNARSMIAAHREGKALPADADKGFNPVTKKMMMHYLKHTGSGSGQGVLHAGAPSSAARDE